MNKFFLTMALSLIPTSFAFGSLTIERIYEEPSLSGPDIDNLKMSPAGDRVTYLKGFLDGDTQRNDLWEFNIKTGKHQLLLESKVLRPDEVELSDDEKARRERQRLSAKGFTSYQWSRDGKFLLFPLEGDLYYYDINSKKPIQITKTIEFETDPKISPEGHYISYIRNQNLFVFDLKTKAEQTVTKKGKETIRYGQAEFVAQEEMGRMTGYWWSPQDKRIVVSRVDESIVQEQQRYEIYGDQLKSYNQRYPQAGTTNAQVSLTVYDLKTKRHTVVDLGKNQDIYLARVNWNADGSYFLVQRQSRDQKTLDVLKFSSKGGRGLVLFSEKDSRWVNLHDDLRFLNNDELLWKSDRDGSKQLYRVSKDGKNLTKLTQGPGVVRKIVGFNKDEGKVYYLSDNGNPIEQHLFQLDLKSRKSKRLTQIPGYHSAIFDKKAQYYIHYFSAWNILPSTALRRVDGHLVTTLNKNQLEQSHPYYEYKNTMPQLTFGKIKASDGSDLHYQLLKPFNFSPEKKYPVVVRVYGGPGAQLVTNSWGGSSFFFDQYLTEQGFIVFTLDNRGSANRDAKFEKILHRKLGDVEVEDQIAGVKYLRTLPYVLPNNIGVFGWSYGGYMAIMSMFKGSSYFLSGVAVAPVTGWDLYDTHYTERFLEHPEKNQKGYENSSVFPYIDGYKDGLLLIHGMADDNVLFTNMTKLIQEMQDRSLPFDMMTYPGKKHGIRGKNTRIHLFKHIAKFLKNRLQ